MTNRETIIDVNDVERAMQQMGKMQQRGAKTNGPTPHSVSSNEMTDGPPWKLQERPQREVSIVENVSEFTNFIAGFLEETAQEEVTRAQQFAEHLRALATRVRETGIGSQR